MGFDPLYLLLIIPALLGWFAQERVRATYEKQAVRLNSLGLSGLEAAKYLLAQHGLSRVSIERAEGHLTDHYDPQNKTLRLSDDVAHGRSLTALSIVAHEVGHAAQDAQGYRFMRLRTVLGRRISVVTQWSSFILIGGLLLGISILMALGGVMLAGLALFSLVTLPAERNASDRALASLRQMGLAAAEELAGMRRVLRAAAFTYLAGAAQRLGTSLFLAIAVLAARGV
jgi:Zn-dependent membrane protease YugP